MDKIRRFAFGLMTQLVQFLSVMLIVLEHVRQNRIALLGRIRARAMLMFVSIVLAYFVQFKANLYYCRCFSPNNYASNQEVTIVLLAMGV